MNLKVKNLSLGSLSLLLVVVGIGYFVSDAKPKAKNYKSVTIDSSKSNNAFSQMVIDKFLNLGGLSDLNSMSESELKHLCMYGANLIMGGDNYGNLYGSSESIAMNLNTHKDQDYYKYVYGIASEYNISPERVEYSAVYSESQAYKNLQLNDKYIILSQTEKAIVKANFDFEDKKIMPTWWVNLNDKYDHDRLLEKIREEKETIIKEMHKMSPRNGHLK